MKTQKIIGYWYSKYSPEHPMPTANVQEFPNKSNIVAALRKKERSASKSHYRGWSNCRICHAMNGSVEYSSGNFAWPEGYLHYLEEHNVIPDAEFVKWLNPKEMDENN